MSLRRKTAVVICEALERQSALLTRMEFFRGRSVAAERLTAGLTEFDTYIRNNGEFVPNFGERYRQGETISTAFVESVDQSRGQPALCQKAADAVDTSWSASVAANPHQGLER